MKISFFFLLIFTTSCSTPKNINDFDEFFYKGILNYKDQKYRIALIQLEKASKFNPDEKPQPYFYAAAAALHLNEKEKAKELIVAAIENTNPKQDYFKRFVEFNKFRHLKIFENINQNYSKYTKNFYANLKHPEIEKEIDSLIEVDQKVRTNNKPTEAMFQVDSTNIVRLIQITQKYGWQENGELLLWHQRGTYKEKNWVWNYFKSVINQEIKNGNIRKSFWIQYDEFINVMEKGYQLYGMYPNNYEMFPLRDPNSVDKRRDSLNLQPLWVMNKIYGWPLPDNYNKN